MTVSTLREGKSSPKPKKPHRQDAEGTKEKNSFTAKDAKVAKELIIRSRATTEGRSEGFNY